MKKIKNNIIKFEKLEKLKKPEVITIVEPVILPAKEFNMIMSYQDEEASLFSRCISEPDIRLI